MLYASDPAFLDAVLADERGWRPFRLEPMTMLVFRHEVLMELSRESLEFIAQAKRGRHRERGSNKPERTVDEPQ